jgi:hypothetical protein
MTNGPPCQSLDDRRNVFEPPRSLENSVGLLVILLDPVDGNWTWF